MNLIASIKPKMHVKTGILAFGLIVAISTTSFQISRRELQSPINPRRVNV